jgi:hypothetical protein
VVSATRAQAFYDRTVGEKQRREQKLAELRREQQQRIEEELRAQQAKGVGSRPPSEPKGVGSRRTSPSSTPTVPRQSPVPLSRLASPRGASPSAPSLYDRNVEWLQQVRKAHEQKREQLFEKLTAPAPKKDEKRPVQPRLKTTQEQRAAGATAAASVPSMRNDGYGHELEQLQVKLQSLHSYLRPRATSGVDTNMDAVKRRREAEKMKPGPLDVRQELKELQELKRALRGH